jgi:hypothetical protein
MNENQRFDMQETASSGESPPEEAAVFEKRKRDWRFVAGLLLILAGAAALFMTGITEYAWRDDQPWAFALLAPDDDPDTLPESDAYKGVREVRIRRVQQHGGSMPHFLEEIQQALDEEPLPAAELPTLPETSVVMMPVSPEELKAVTAAGRIPDPGQPEVLGGALTAVDSIMIGDTAFTVTGRMKGSTAGFIRAFLLPEHENFRDLFSSGDTATRGWFHPEGMATLRDSFAEADSARFEGMQTLSHPAFAWTGWALMVMMAAGGMLFYAAIFGWLASKTGWILPREVRERPVLFYGMHLFLYGLFFLFMAEALRMPALNLMLGEYMRSLFTEGELSYIGDAYASGNIPRATAATFVNNYVVQTLGLTFLISIPPLALGVLKTAVSFALVGFIMAPLWAGTAIGYSFHGVTMVLELEAYILAAFAVTLWPVRIYETFLNAEGPAGIVRGIRMLLGAALITGVMLLIAALYEATTLILFGG